MATESKPGAGALIILVIFLGGAWVCYGMFRQTEIEAPPMPTVPTRMAPQAKSLMSPENNPYVAALLAPDGSPGVVRQTERFSQLLKKKLGQNADNKDVGNWSNAYVDQSLELISAAAEKGETEQALVQVKKALDYANTHQGVAKRARIDLALNGGRLSYGLRDFDQSRLFVDQAIILAHQERDYKMQDLEGLRCLLNGDFHQASQYDLTQAQYNDSFTKADYKQLPALADTLLQATSSLPRDSYFSLVARLNKGTAMVMTGDDAGKTRDYLKNVESLAIKGQDAEIAANCRQLLARMDSN